MTYMTRALSLARGALGTASPNPAVGAVVVKDELVVGEGWTQAPGQSHAEGVALKQAGPKAAGAALYVTLEPCNHFGRTPPCTENIVKAGISKVYVAMIDPNPLVNGKGISRLNEAGIQTIVGDREEEARELTEAYAKFITTGLPFITAKFAMSLDGKTATRMGDSKWVTGKESRHLVHQMRAASDAIMVGIHTVLQDDPQLTTRDESGAPYDRQPLRVLVDSHGRTPSEARLLSEPGETLIAVTTGDKATQRRLRQLGAQVKTVKSENGRVNLRELIKALGEREVTSVLVEGGGTLLGSLFDQGLVNKVAAFIAPTIIGGKSALPAVGGVGAERLAQARHLNRVKMVCLGDDVFVSGYC